MVIAPRAFSERGEGTIAEIALAISMNKYARTRPVAIVLVAIVLGIYYDLAINLVRLDSHPPRGV